MTTEITADRADTEGELTLEAVLKPAVAACSVSQSATQPLEDADGAEERQADAQAHQRTAARIVAVAAIRVTTKEITSQGQERGSDREEGP